jgi:hypothetical protein
MSDGSAYGAACAARAACCRGRVAIVYLPFDARCCMLNIYVACCLVGCCSDSRGDRPRRHAPVGAASVLRRAHDRGDVKHAQELICAPRPHLRRDRARPCRRLSWDRARPSPHLRGDLGPPLPTSCRGWAHPFQQSVLRPAGFAGALLLRADYPFPLFPLFVPLIPLIPVIRTPYSRYSCAALYSRSSIPLFNSQVHCCRALALLAQHEHGRAAFEKEWDEAAGACAALTCAHICASPVWAPPGCTLPHLHRDCGPPRPHLRRDCGSPRPHRRLVRGHIGAGTRVR